MICGDGRIMLETSLAHEFPKSPLTLQPGPSPYPSLRIGQTWRRPTGARGRETNYDRRPWSASCGSGRVHTSSPGCVSEAALSFAFASNYSGHLGWPSRAARDPRPSQSRPAPGTQRQERDIKHERQGSLTVVRRKRTSERERKRERERVSE